MFTIMFETALCRMHFAYIVYSLRVVFTLVHDSGRRCCVVLPPAESFAFNTNFEYCYLTAVFNTCLFMFGAPFIVSSSFLIKNVLFVIAVITRVLPAYVRYCLCQRCLCRVQYVLSMFRRVLRAVDSPHLVRCIHWAALSLTDSRRVRGSNPIHTSSKAGCHMHAGKRCFN